MLRVLFFSRTEVTRFAGRWMSPLFAGAWLLKSFWTRAFFRDPLIFIPEFGREALEISR